MQKALLVFVILSLGVLVTSKHAQLLGGRISGAVSSISGAVASASSAAPSVSSAVPSVSSAAPPVSSSKPSGPEDYLNTLRRSSPRQIQGNIDKAVNSLSGFLTAPDNQELIKNVTRRANNLLRLINLQHVRKAALQIVDEVFSSLTSLQSSLIEKLTALNSSANPIDDLKNQLQELAFELFIHFNSINETAQTAFEQLRQNYSNGPIQFADNETLGDVQSLIGYLTGEVRARTGVALAKYQTVARVLSFQSNIINIVQRRRLENEIRRQATQLARDLRNLNITNLHGFTTNAFNIVIDQVDSVLDQAGSLANRALASSTPGNVINDALLELKVGLGQKVSDFQKNAESTLSRYIRDALNAFNMRNVSGNNIQQIFRNARVRVTARVNEIVSLVNRVLAI